MVKNPNNPKLARVYLSSVKWGLLARNGVGLFHIFNHVKPIKNH